MNNPYNQPSYQPQYQPPPQPPYEYWQSRNQTAMYRKPLRRWANVIGGGMLMVQLIMIAVYYALYFAFYYIGSGTAGYEMRELIDQSMQLTAYVLGFWVPILFMAAMIHIPWNVACPMRRPRASIAIPAVFICLGASMVGSMLSGMLSYAIETIFGVTPIMPDMPIPDSVAAVVIYAVSLVIAPAIFEEIMFRGVILQSLRRFGDGFAIVTSAVLFGICHNNLVQGPNAFIMGLVIGYFVVRTGSILTGMLIHFVNNGFALLFTWLAEVITEEQYMILNMSVFFSYIIAGIAALIFLMVRYGNPFRVARSDYPLTSGRKCATFFLAITVIISLVVSVALTIPNFE